MREVSGPQSLPHFALRSRPAALVRPCSARRGRGSSYRCCTPRAGPGAGRSEACGAHELYAEQLAGIDAVSLAQLVESSSSVVPVQEADFCKRRAGRGGTPPAHKRESGRTFINSGKFAKSITVYPTHAIRPLHRASCNAAAPSRQPYPLKSRMTSPISSRTVNCRLSSRTAAFTSVVSSRSSSQSSSSSLDILSSAAATARALAAQRKK